MYLYIPLQTLNAPTRMEDPISDNSYQHYYSCWENRLEQPPPLHQSVRSWPVRGKLQLHANSLPSVMGCRGRLASTLRILQIICGCTGNELHQEQNAITLLYSDYVAMASY